MTKGCLKNRLDVIGIQEHRLQTKHDIDVMIQPEYTLYYSSADINGNGGVGILVKKYLVNAIINISKISERIIYITLKCNPVINIVVTYAPTETSTEQQNFKLHHIYII